MKLKVSYRGEAVRITNNNDEAVAICLYGTRALETQASRSRAKMLDT